MYNEKICQRLRAKIDSSLFPDQENGKYVLAGWGFTSSIILRLDIDSMPMLTMIFTIIEVKFMSQTLLHILGMISGYNRKVRVEKENIENCDKSKRWHISFS